MWTMNRVVTVRSRGTAGMCLKVSKRVPYTQHRLHMSDLQVHLRLILFLYGPMFMWAYVGYFVMPTSEISTVLRRLSLPPPIYV